METSTTYFERALKIAQENSDESGEAFAYMGLGGLADLKGNVQDALTFFGRAIDRFRKLGNHQLEALALSNIGSLYRRFGDAESALDYYLRSQEVRKLAPNRVNEANLVGNIAKAYVVLAAGHEPSRETALAILRYTREHLAPYKRIRRIEFAELPKTISGKIRRVELRERAEGGWSEADFPELKAT